eukprot:4347752-Prymnesium_polylepis.1
MDVLVGCHGRGVIAKTRCLAVMYAPLRPLQVVYTVNNLFTQDRRLAAPEVRCGAVSCRSGSSGAALRNLKFFLTTSERSVWV